MYIYWGDIEKGQTLESESWNKQLSLRKDVEPT